MPAVILASRPAFADESAEEKLQQCISGLNAIAQKAKLNPRTFDEQMVDYLIESYKGQVMLSVFDPSDNPELPPRLREIIFSPEIGSAANAKLCADIVRHSPYKIPGKITFPAALTAWLFFLETENPKALYEKHLQCAAGLIGLNVLLEVQARIPSENRANQRAQYVGFYSEALFPFFGALNFQTIFGARPPYPSRSSSQNTNNAYVDGKRAFLERKLAVFIQETMAKGMSLGYSPDLERWVERNCKICEELEQGRFIQLMKNFKGNSN